ncbi:WG repeat-containing protein [Fulvitalea axinellae]
MKLMTFSDKDTFVSGKSKVLRHNSLKDCKAVSLLAMVFSMLSFLACGANAGDYKVFEDHGKKGISNASGKVLIPAEYEDLGWADDKVPAVWEGVVAYRKDGKWGLVNLRNKRLTSAKYERFLPFRNGILVAERKSPNGLNLQGLVSVKGEEISAFEYLDLEASGNLLLGRRQVGLEYLHGAFDTKGTVKVSFLYRGIRDLDRRYLAVKNSEGKEAIFGRDGKRVSDFFADSLGVFFGKKAVFTQNGMAGVVTDEGQIALQPKYKEIDLADSLFLPFPEWEIKTPEKSVLGSCLMDSLSPAGEGFYLGVRGNRMFLLSDKADEIGGAVASELGNVAYGALVYRDSAFFGLMDSDGNKMTEAKYHQIIRQGGFMLAKRYGSRRYVIDILNSKGKAVGPKGFSDFRVLNRDYIAVKRGRFWGVYGQDGLEKISCKYDSVYHKRKGLFKVGYWGKQGYLDNQEKWVLSPREGDVEYDTVAGNYEILYEGEFRLLTPAGKELFSSEDKVEAHPLGYLVTDKKGRQGLVNRKGQWIVWQEYEKIRTLRAGSAFALRKAGKERLLLADDYKMPLSRRLNVTDLKPYSGDWVGVKVGDKYGFYDEQGRMRISYRYEDVGSCVNQRCAVRLMGKWGFVDENEKLVVQPWFDQAWDFTYGTAKVRKENTFGIVDKDGDYVIPVEYDEVQKVMGGGIVRKGKKYGFFNAKGQHVLSTRFDFAEPIGERWIKVGKDGEYGVIDHRGLWLFPMMYEEVRFDANAKVFMLKKHPEAVEAPKI